MEAPAWAAYTVACLIPIALLLLTNHHLSHKPNLPPGSKPWPIIGNFNLIGPLPHRSIQELSKKYGPIMMFKFGSVPVVVGSSVEIAKSVLKTCDKSFADKPRLAARKYITYNYSDIAWSQYNPYLRQARKICSMELFSVKRLESLQYIRVEELKFMLRDIFNANGETITLKEHLSNLSLNVISRMVLGKKYLDEGNNNEEDDHG